MIKSEELVKQIILRERRLGEMIAKSKKALEKAPEGLLKVNRHGNGWQYYYREAPTDKNGKYLKKGEERLARALAQKRYNEKVLLAAERECTALKKLRKAYENGMAEEVYEVMQAPVQRLVQPIQKSDAEYRQEWLGQSYTKKGFLQNMPEYYSENGERMRSKSEVLIAGLLRKLEIPYLYEKPLFLKGWGIVYPDFTILDVRRRKEIYWEHMGMMDDGKYREKAFAKLELYEKNGLYLGENLLISLETEKQLLDLRLLEEKLKHLMGI